MQTAPTNTPPGEISRIAQLKLVEDKFNNIYWILKNRCLQTPQVIQAVDSMASTYSEVLAAIRDHYAPAPSSEVLESSPIEKSSQI